MTTTLPAIDPGRARLMEAAQRRPMFATRPGQDPTPERLNHTLNAGRFHGDPVEGMCTSCGSTERVTACTNPDCDAQTCEAHTVDVDWHTGCWCCATDEALRLEAETLEDDPHAFR